MVIIILKRHTDFGFGAALEAKSRINQMVVMVQLVRISQNVHPEV